MEKPRSTPPPQYPPRTPPQPGTRRPPPQPARPLAQTPAAIPPPAPAHAPAHADFPPARAVTSPHLIIALAVLLEAALRLAQTGLEAKTFFTDQSHSTLATIAQGLAALAVASGILSLIGGVLLLMPKHLAIPCILTGAASAILLELAVQIVLAYAYAQSHGFQLNGPLLRQFLQWARLCLAPAFIFVLMSRSDVLRSTKWQT
ncbi:MAG TPA: hypothetical protein VMD30_09165 [Tepidisphaeraceae bacterium]|nr:hypothetical protein [Tepidisphaeraceae bacterium]